MPSEARPSGKRARSRRQNTRPACLTGIRKHAAPQAAPFRRHLRSDCQQSG
ncbi:hypothetical protein [Neisseria benedictiae]|uniref:hypothetical protein n=1 Tax=Neisseria benedictiae TaxID=2830649 RepID=UPI00265A0E3F|nr:hypothetical protein [Neisseria benedictiae]